MNNEKLPTVRVCEHNGQSNLSKAQKSFNKLIKQIESKRKLLAAWQTTITAYHSQYAMEFDPLMQRFNQNKKEMVVILDKAYSGKGFTKNEKRKLSDVVCSLSVELIAECGYTDLKEIYNRHSESDFDSDLGECQDMMRSMVEDMLGIPLGEEFKIGSTEEMMAHLDEKIKEKLAQEEKAHQKRTELKAKRKKSSATIAREAKLQEETKHMSQSVREVYRKLVSVLHPDREQDTTERQRKTEMMQRANVLYDRKDLLGLLELQLEIEQIDQAKINTISEERLTYYNKVLAEQYEELLNEIQTTEISFRLRFNIPPIIKLSPDAAIRSLQCNIKNLKINIEDLNKDLVSFQDKKKIKMWLKTIQESSLSGGDMYRDLCWMEY